MNASMIQAAALPALAMLVAAGPSRAQEAGEAVSVVDALNCRLTAPQYTGFALSIGGEDGIAAQRKWQRIASTNPFMNEYELPDRVVVAGGHETRRIGFTASAIVALIDLADPTDLARAEGIDNAVSAAPFGAASGFRKFLGERVLADVTQKPGDTEEWGTHFVIAKTISTVTTHPGKTLYGCSYRIEVTDKDGNAL